MSSMENNLFSAQTSVSKLWCEKYRPATIATYIGNDSLRKNMETCIKNQSIGNILLHGLPGTGKTTLGKLLINCIQCDSLVLNASEHNSVDTVRGQIKDFVESVGFTGLKIVLLDEFDYFSQSGQAALRNIIEENSNHARFILTCNYPEKIMDAIASRCEQYEVNPPSKKEVARHVRSILDNEKIVYELDVLAKVIHTKYPDIRNILLTLQQYSMSGTLTLPESFTMVDDTIATKIMTKILTSTAVAPAFSDIRQLITDAGMRNFTSVYKGMFDAIPKEDAILAGMYTMHIAEAQYQDAFVVNKEITFLSAIYKMLKEKHP